MRRIMLWGIAIAAILAGVAGGYRLGSGQWPAWHTIAFVARGEKPGASEEAPTERPVLYWKHPDGAADFSPTPKKTPGGREYVPVFDDQEADFKDAKAKSAADAKNGKNARGKVLYYRNPMGLPDTSPVPKKDWMGMDYIPVYEGEEESGSAIKISLDKVQRSGVRTEAAEMRYIARPVRAPGVSKPDERTLWSVTLRADAFIEELYVNETGKHVTAGERLFRFYSPQVVSAQIDYRVSGIAPIPAPGQRGGGEPSGLQKLRNLGLPESVLNQIRASQGTLMSIDWPAPVTGVVMEKKAISGQMVRAGEELYRLADLTSIWVIADVAEQDIGQVRVGNPARITFRAFPDQPFDGRVTFVLHELDARTRTGKVRIEVKNPEHRIKHEMYADVEIDAAVGEPKRLTVPVSALIDSGNRQVVIVERGEGLFEPRPVKLGQRSDGFIEIREGLKAGEKVVVTANFLIDAESNLRAALKGFTADSPTPPGASPETRK
jgi:membrane fusion protein, copper/silver efflux system